MPVVDGNLFLQGQLTASSITASGVLASSLTANSIQVSSGVVIGAGVSTGGNTAGNTGIQTGTLVFQGTNNITLSQITGAGGIHTIQISGAAGGVGGGATLSMFPWPQPGVFTQTVNSGTTAATGGSTQTTCSIYIAPMVLPYNLSYRSVELVQSQALSVNGTGSASGGHLLGIYTLNAATLSLLSSYIFNYQLSQNSTSAQSHYWYWGTNSTSNSSSLGGDVSASFTGIRRIQLYGAEASFAKSQYWAAWAHTMMTAGAAGVGHISVLMEVSASQSSLGSYLGENTWEPAYPYHGIISTTSNGTTTGLLVMPGSIGVSDITLTSATSTAYRSVLARFLRT
jgi:hypothetical protein